MTGLPVSVDIHAGPTPLTLRDCVVRVDFRSALSEMFELTLEVALRTSNFDFREAIGRAVTVHFDEEPFLRRVDGVIRRMRQLRTESEGISSYELSVVPPVWLAT